MIRYVYLIGKSSLYKQNKVTRSEINFRFRTHLISFKNPKLLKKLFQKESEWRELLLLNVYCSKKRVRVSKLTKIYSWIIFYVIYILHLFIKTTLKIYKNKCEIRMSIRSLRNKNQKFTLEYKRYLINP